MEEPPVRSGARGAGSPSGSASHEHWIPGGEEAYSTGELNWGLQPRMLISNSRAKGHLLLWSTRQNLPPASAGSTLRSGKGQGIPGSCTVCPEMLYWFHGWVDEAV